MSIEPSSRSLVLANTYPMLEVLRLWRAGVHPEHHLWGVSRLSDRFKVEYAPLVKNTRFERVLRVVGLTRNVRSQLVYAWKFRSATVFYGASFGITRVLGILKRLGLFSPKLVCLVHHRHTANYLDRTALSGFDLIVCLSELAKNDVLTRCPSLAGRVRMLGWAVDIEFYREWRGGRRRLVGEALRVIAAGKDHRDYETMVRGVVLSKIELDVQIICSKDIAPITDDRRVSVVEGVKGNKLLGMNDLCAHYSTADVIAIPLVKADRVAGLTSLLDALALGMPVLMTRNPGIDIDIEALGCGYWVDADDPQGWASAFEKLAESPDRIAAMGANALAFAESELALPAYANRLSSYIEEAIDGRLS